MKRPAASARFLEQAAIAVLLSTALTGCLHPVARQDPAPAKFKDFQLVYFKPELHRRLYVEVDAVKCAEYSDAELSMLEAKLREWTQRTDGVSVVRSSVIPRSAARGQSPESLARIYLDGPPAVTNESSPAYIYILVYDSRLNRDVARSPRAASVFPVSDKVPAELAAPENPHVRLFPYPAMIYVDRSWLGGLPPEKYWDQALLHEAAHVLGLVSRDSQVENSHCTTGWCLMCAHMSESIKSDILSWLERKGPKPLLCDACANELREYQTSANVAPTHFVGPVLVRSMPKYHVMALPGFTGLYIGDSVDGEAGDFTDAFRKLKGLGPSRYSWDVQENLKRESVSQSIEAAKLDVDPLVRYAAGELERKLHNETNN